MQEGGTMVIPGHGRLCDESEVSDYRDMLTIIRDRVQNMLHKGKTLEEVKAARAEPGLRSAIQHQRVDRRHVRRSHLQKPGRTPPVIAYKMRRPGSRQR